ncbi:MAG TPA: Uma2 family endonuclease [Micromonosporaceae bacterium]|nr:Uma2 family endonuclease [Micromonosporaceae bacterium]
MTVTGQNNPWLPTGRAWTADDLDGLPDDGLQYELFDGVLVVSPAPVPRHQRAVLAIYRLLYADCPPELEVFVAPLDFRPTRGRSLQPDVLVVRRDQVGEKHLQHPPVLAVEVLSESTRSKDLLLKPTTYARSGVASFWVLDPDVPSFLAYDLRDGKYVETAKATGDEAVTVAAPYPVVVRPSDIVAGQPPG